MKKNEYITKEYFDKTLDKKFDERFEIQDKKMRQHITDLVSGFNEKIRGVCDQVTSVDERLTRLDNKVSVMDDRVSGMDRKIDHIQSDIILIKDVLVEKTDRKDTLVLSKRVTKIEGKIGE